MKQSKNHKRKNLSRQELMDREFQKSIERSFSKANFSDADCPPVDLFDVDRLLDDKRPSPADLMLKSPVSVVVKEEQVSTEVVPEKFDTTKTETLLLTVVDLCNLLKVSRSTITRMEREGSLPGRIMIGGNVRYNREIIEKWVYDAASK